jgi:formamidopyrimidine-DNA glycosylase
MPELPEVETVRRELSKKIVGKTVLPPFVYVDRSFSGKKEEAAGKILSVERKGKFLILPLSADRRLVFHLRMEGKLFVVGNKHSLSHLSLFFPFEGEEGGLAFYDVRKFGICYLLSGNEEGPLSRVGKEPSEIEDPLYLYDRIHSRHKKIKETLLDQSILAGLGNIYSDEVLFQAHVSPFKKSYLVTKEETARILDAAKKILSKAIEENGSTVRSYRATEDLSGSYQNFLKVYGREGKECLVCHKAKIEKRKLAGRGTSFCPCCQHTGISLAVTGKIGSGKSLASSYFRKEGFVLFSADEEVKKLSREGKTKAELKKRFPDFVTEDGLIDKEKASAALLQDSSFRKKYDAFWFSLIRERAEQFLIANDGKDKVLEIPLLFDAHMEKMFSFIAGCETTRQKKHLKERGEKDIEGKIQRNLVNSYDRNRHKLSFILDTSGTKKHLEEQVREAARKMREEYGEE